jgi:hypothetical protein
MRRNLTLYPYEIQVVQMLTAAIKQRRSEFCRNFSQFVQLYPTTLDWPWFNDEARFHFDEFLNTDWGFYGFP